MLIHTQPDVYPTSRYSVNEVAEILGVTRQTLYAWFRQGIMKFDIRKCNGRRFVVGSEILKVWRNIY